MIGELVHRPVQVNYMYKDTMVIKSGIRKKASIFSTHGTVDQTAYALDVGTSLYVWSLENAVLETGFNILLNDCSLLLFMQFGNTSVHLSPSMASFTVDIKTLTDLISWMLLQVSVYP